MMDRYEDEKIDLEMKERTGSKFITCAKNIYLELARLQESKRIRLNEKFPMIVGAVSELDKLYQNEELLRYKFQMPATLRDDYHFAKKRYQRMKGNPQSFYDEDEKRRADLEKEKEMLANRIRNFEIEYAREEDQKRLEDNEMRISLNSELAVLKYKKQKYEKKTESSTAKCFAVCNKKGVNKLDEVNQRIGEIEERLKKLGPLVTESLKEKRYHLQLLHKRRWDVDKALDAHQVNTSNKLHRWQNAIDNAEVVMVVRQMDIDDAINRYYATFSTQLIHAFLNVYCLVMDCVAQAGIHADLLDDEVKQFNTLSDLISCPDIANRTVKTLYKKMQILEEKDRAQIIHEKPVRDHLPAALVKTFSIKNFTRTVSELGLYRKILASPHPEEFAVDAESASLKNGK